MILTKIFILIAFLVQLFDSSHSVDIQCDYETVECEYDRLDLIYFCHVRNNLNIITRESAIIDSASGIHKDGNNNKKVVAFQALAKALHFFPRGLKHVFGDLEVIKIYSCGLKEIRQLDLKPFTQLIDLSLADNEIKVLEKGLFKFNRLLINIYLVGNKIAHIDVDVFQHLSLLTSLYLVSNICIDSFAESNEADVRKVINEASEKCQDQDFLTVERNLKELEGNLPCSSLEMFVIFNIKFEQVQSKVANSKFSDFFEERMKKLTASKDKKCSTVQGKIHQEPHRFDLIAS